MKTECDYLYGWIKKTVTYTKFSPKNGELHRYSWERRKRKIISAMPFLNSVGHCFNMSLKLTGSFAPTISITLFNQDHYPTSGCNKLFGDKTVTYTKISSVW